MMTDTVDEIKELLASLNRAVKTLASEVVEVHQENVIILKRIKVLEARHTLRTGTK